MSENNDDTLLDDLPDDVEYDIANEDEDALLADDELDEPAAQYLQSGGDDAADQEEYQVYEEEPLEDVLELGVTEDLLDSEIQDSAELTPAVQELSISRSSASRDPASSSRLKLRSTSQETMVAVAQSLTVMDAATLAGESEEEDDKHGEQRNRFKSERTNVVSLKSNKSFGNIPDSLDRVVTAEETSRQKFTGRKESGWRGRRGRARGAGVRQAFHQVQQQFQQHASFPPQPQKILINPHFRGLPHQQGAGVMAVWEGDRVPAGLPPQQQFPIPPHQGQFPPPPSPQHFEQPAFYHQPPPPPQPQHPPQQIYLEQAVAPVWTEEGALYPPHLQAPPPTQHFSGPPPHYDQPHVLPQQMFRPHMESRPPMQYRQPNMFRPLPPRPRFPGTAQQMNMMPLQHRNAAVRPQAACQPQQSFRPLHKRLSFDKQQRFELPAKRKKRMPDMSNLHEVQTVDTLPDTTVSEVPQQEMEVEDEETREYRKKIEEQKRLREKILQQKEERRKKAALQKQMQLQQQQQLQQVNTSGEPPQGNAIATIVNRNTVQPVRSQSVVQRLGSWGRGRGRGRGGRQVVHQQHTQTPAPMPAVTTPVTAPQQRPRIFTVRTKTGEVKQVWGTVVQSQTGQRVVRCVPQQTLQQRRIVVTQQPTPQPAAQPRQVVAGRGRTVLLRATEPPAQPQPQTQRIVVQKSTQAEVGGTRVVLPKKAVNEGAFPQQVLPSTKIVSIDNLAASTNEAQLRKMCQRVGTVESLQMYAKQRRAVVTFSNPAAAATFFKRGLIRRGRYHSYNQLQEPRGNYAASKHPKRIVIMN